MDKDREKKTIQIAIDRQTYEVEKEAVTGAELRALAKPPIGTDRDLFLDVPGSSKDDLIENDEKVKLKKDMHFFTTPTSITPGGHAPPAG